MNEGKTMQAIKPLYDDVDKWSTGNWRRCLSSVFLRDFALSQCLRDQLKARPNVWGKGLWPDAESEAVGKICAESFDWGYGTDSTNFIPEDSLRMIFAMDEDEGMASGSVDVSISYDMGFKIPDAVYCAVTLGEMVQQIVSLRHKRIGEGLPVISDEELADHLNERCVIACESSAEDVKIFMGEIARWFLPWRLFPGLFPWLLALSLLAAVYIVSSVAFELCGRGEVGLVVTRVIWTLMAIAYAIWKGRGDGVQGIVYHLVLMGFSAGFLWNVMGRTPVDKIVALLR